MLCVWAALHVFALALVRTDVPDNPREGAASQPVSGQHDDTCAAEFAKWQLGIHPAALHTRKVLNATREDLLADDAGSLTHQKLLLRELFGTDCQHAA